MTVAAVATVATRKPTAIYRFYGEKDVLLYVGITDRFGVRWSNHAKQKPWWPEVRRHTAEWFDTREEAADAEKVAIKTERPKHNIVHQPRPPKPPKPKRVRPKPAPRTDPQADPEADYWTLQDVAAHLGIKYDSARREKARGNLPDPDKVFGRSPAWRPATILNHQRPGKGARTDLASGGAKTTGEGAPDA